MDGSPPDGKSSEVNCLLLRNCRPEDGLSLLTLKVEDYGGGELQLSQYSGGGGGGGGDDDDDDHDDDDVEEEEDDDDNDDDDDDDDDDSSSL